MADETKAPSADKGIENKLKAIPQKWLIAGGLAIFLLIFLIPKITLSSEQIIILVGAGVLGYLLLTKKADSKSHITYEQAGLIVFNLMTSLQADGRNGIKDGRIEISPERAPQKNPWSGKISDWFVIGKIINDDGVFNYSFKVDYYTGEISYGNEKDSKLSIERDATQIKLVPNSTDEDLLRFYYGGEE